jgi:hypothetical protein
MQLPKCSNFIIYTSVSQTVVGVVSPDDSQAVSEEKSNAKIV